MKINVLFFVAAVVVYVSAADEWTCETGVAYIENDCNTCDCLDGELECGRMSCAHQESKDMEKCSAYGEATQRNCNSCVCTETYGTVCTNKPC